MRMMSYEELCGLVGDNYFLQSVKRAIEGKGTDLDSRFVRINNEVVEVVEEDEK